MSALPPKADIEGVPLRVRRDAAEREGPVLDQLTSLGSSKPVASVTRHTSPPVAFPDLHKSTAADKFTVSSRNCIVEVAAQLAALGCASLRQFAKSLQNILRRAATVSPPVPRCRLRN